MSTRKTARSFLDWWLTLPVYIAFLFAPIVGLLYLAAIIRNKFFSEEKIK